MARAGIFVVLALATLLLAGVSAQELSKQFEGVFDIDIAKSTSADHFHAQEVVTAKMNISRSGAALVGRVTDLSGEIDVEFQIQFLTQTSGEVFLIRAAGFDVDTEDQEESSEIGGGQSVLEFEFANRTGGAFVSQSQFKGVGAKKAHAGFYQALLVGRNLVLTINDGTNQLTINGLKAVEVAEQSWLSRFSLPLMMVVMMFVQRWMRPAQPAVQTRAENAVNQQRRRAAGAPASGNARVEELPEDKKNE